MINQVTHRHRTIDERIQKTSAVGFCEYSERRHGYYILRQLYNCKGIFIL